MIEHWVSASKLAEITGKHKTTIRRRADKEKWAKRMFNDNGGKQYRYRLADLPEDVQLAYALSMKTSLDGLRAQLAVPERPDKKVCLPMYSGRGAKVKKPAPLDQIPEHRLHIASLRQQVIMARERSGLSVEDFINAYQAGVAVPELKEKLGGFGNVTTYQSFYRWLETYEQHGLAGLAPQYPVKRGGNGASMSEEEKELIRALYLDKNKPKCKAVWRDLLNLIDREINYHMVYRYVTNEIPRPVKVYYREGEKAYHDKFDPYVKRDYSLFNSMDWGNGDHHNFDFVIKHDGKIMRPWVTAFADLRSRTVTGWHIDVIPSTLTILRAWDSTLRDYGPFKNLILDNGKDFKAYWFAGDTWKSRKIKDDSAFWDLAAGVAYESGTAIHFAEAYRGQAKPIERWFGTVIELFSKRIETYVGSNTADRPDEVKLYWGNINGRNKKEVKLTLEELREEFGKFVKWFNTQWQHSGDGMDGKTPLQVFEENLFERRVMSETFRLYIMTRREPRTVSRSGVVIDGIDYYTQEMLEHIGQEVEVRRSLDDVGTVSIWKLPERTFLYYANNNVLKDTGVAEENVRKRRKIEKAHREQIKEYGKAKDSLLKGKVKSPAQLLAEEAQENRTPEYPEEQIMQVVNDGPLMPDDNGKPQRAGLILELPSQKPQKRKLKGIFDTDD
jgi:putative transposase